ACFRLAREIRFASGPQLVVGRLEAPPQGLALRTRHVGGLAPLLLQLVNAPRDGVGVRFVAQRFHLFAELFLDADVRPSLPFGHFAQIADARRQRFLRRLQLRADVLEVLARGQRRNVRERRADVAQRPVCGPQRQILFLHQRIDAADQLVHAVERVAAPARFRFFVDAAALGFTGGGVLRRLRGCFALLTFGFVEGVLPSRSLGVGGFALLDLLRRFRFGRDPKFRFGLLRGLARGPLGRCPSRVGFVLSVLGRSRILGGLTRSRIFAFTQNLTRALRRRLVLRPLGNLF